MSLKDRLALLQQQDKKEEEAKGLQADGTTKQTGESARGARGQENQPRNTPEKNSAMAQPQAKPAVHARWEVHSPCVPQLELCWCKLREERCDHSCRAVRGQTGCKVPRVIDLSLDLVHSVVRAACWEDMW